MLSRKIDEILNFAHLKNSDLEYLRKSEQPLVLFGAATMAHAVKSLLDAEGIKIDYVVVDKQYYGGGGQRFCELPVTSFDDVLENEIRFNVIIAFSPGRHLKKQELEKYSQVKRIIFFDVLQFFGVGTDFDFDFVNANYGKFEMVFTTLQDELSRNCFVEFIRAKILKSSEELVKFNVPNEEQYFPQFLKLNDNEIFVDCGAFDGDTVLSFARHAKGNFNKIYAFECDEENALKFLNNTEQYVNKIEFLKKGVWSKAGKLFFNSIETSTSSSYIAENETDGISILVDSIDNVVKNEPVSFIKMDIEGAELEALYGAENTIRRNKPKLAICVYHKREDLITIPQYILSIHNDYKLYLRHYDDRVGELVLYAI